MMKITHAFLGLTLLSAATTYAMEMDHNHESMTNMAPMVMPETTQTQMPMAMPTMLHGLAVHHSEDPSTEEYMHVHHSMHEGMDIEFTGDADIDFLRGMIPHHQGAIDMAAVQQHYGQDGTVKFFTNKVIRAQRKEIRQMEILLETLEYEYDAHVEKSPASTKAFEQTNAKMAKAMSIDYTGNADIDFMVGMIPHHQGAIDMAYIVLEYGDDNRVKALARKIIDAQVDEIISMENWLNRLKWRTAHWR